MSFYINTYVPNSPDIPFPATAQVRCCKPDGSACKSVGGNAKYTFEAGKDACGAGYVYPTIAQALSRSGGAMGTGNGKDWEHVWVRTSDDDEARFNFTVQACDRRGGGIGEDCP